MKLFDAVLLSCGVYNGGSTVHQDEYNQAVQRARHLSVRVRPLITSSTTDGPDVPRALGNVSGFVTSGLADVLRWPAGMDPSWVVQQPLPCADVELLRKLPPTSKVLLTVDHFVHAERIAAMCADRAEEQPVLILLQGELPGPGIRPGQDALRLAQGIVPLPGIRVAGVAVSIVGEPDVAPVISATVHTQQRFRDNRIDCDVVHVMAEVTQVPQPNDQITDYGICPEFSSDGEEPWPLQCEAEVISRPSLAVVVINAARPSDNAAAVCRFPDHPQARVLRWLDGCCVLSADGSAQRLTIGERVRVEYAGGE